MSRSLILDQLLTDLYEPFPDKPGRTPGGVNSGWGVAVMICVFCLVGLFSCGYCFVFFFVVVFSEGFLWGVTVGMVGLILPGSG